MYPPQILDKKNMMNFIMLKKRKENKPKQQK